MPLRSINFRWPIRPLTRKEGDIRYRYKSLNLPFLLRIAILVTAGCGKGNFKTTIAGLQEENAVLKEKITFLEEQVDSSKQQQKEGNAETHSKMKDLKIAHEEFLVREKETHRSQLAQLEKEVSTLKIELGASQRERIVLREMINQDPLIRAAAGTRVGYDLWITGGMLGLLVIALLLLAYRYRVVNDRLQRLTLECVSEIRHSTGEQLFD